MVTTELLRIKHIYIRSFKEEKDIVISIDPILRLEENVFGNFNLIDPRSMNTISLYVASIKKDIHFANTPGTYYEGTHALYCEGASLYGENVNIYRRNEFKDSPSQKSFAMESSKLWGCW